MFIEINDSKTIKDIQDEFSSAYPFLKLEFFQTAHEREEPSNETPCPPEQPIGLIRKRHILGVVDMSPERETGVIEQEFERRFDLNVQIYRLQANNWVQTAGTDILTLHDQNIIARDASDKNFNHRLTEE